LMVHVALPAGSTAPQLFVSAKSPLAAMLVIVSGALPALTNVTVLASLTTFRVWLPKLMD